MLTTKNNINDNHLIFGRYKILKQIGNGAFCKVYSGINKKTKELVAIKFEPKTSKSKSLKSEACFLFKKVLESQSFLVLVKIKNIIF